MSEKNSARTMLDERRPLFFVAANSVHLVLISIFPFALTYLLRDASFYAHLVVYINAAGLLNELVNLGLGRGLAQLAIQTPEGELPQKLRAPLAAAVPAMALQYLFALLVIAVAWLVNPHWFDGSRGMALAFAFAVLPGVFRPASQGLLYGARLYAWFVAGDLMWAAGRIVIVPLGWWWKGIPGALAAIGALMLATVMLGVWRLPKQGIRPGGTFKAGWAALKPVWKFGFWLHLSGTAAPLLRPCVVLIFAAELGKTNPATGFANLAVSLFLLVNIMLDGLFQGLYPEKAGVGANAQPGDGAPLQTLLRFAATEARALVYLMAPLAWIGFAIAPYAIRLLPLKYHEAAPLMAVITLALPARAMGAAYSIALQAAQRPGAAARWQWGRLGLDLAGAALGLYVFKQGPVAAMWGIFAGEWCATLALVKVHAAAVASGVKARPALPIALSAVVFSLAAGLFGATGRGAGTGVLMVLWLGLIPAAGLSNWREIAGLMRTHAPRENATIDEVSL